MMEFAQLIQGGMGIGISGWRLAGAVAGCGQMGVISGLCLDEMLARKLQIGDPGGYVRKALENFPIRKIAKNVLDRFFNEKGKGKDVPFIPVAAVSTDEERNDLLVAGSFAEMYLAKQGHSGVVWVNLLQKCQSDTIPTLYGCMLAGADFVTMGAGIPREIPGVLDRLSDNDEAEIRLTVAGSTSADDYRISFDPKRYEVSKLKRPSFLAIISSNVLALTLAKKSNGEVNGFIIEGATAGGHNAPPRGGCALSEKGEPIYGEKDTVDLAKIKEIGLPFWLAGGYSIKGKLKEAMALGAQGIQAGTAFLLCEESGLVHRLKELLIKIKCDVFTNPFASPTGFPFKEVKLDGTLSEPEVYSKRPRMCNLGYLRERFRNPDGSLGFRCAAESIKAFIAKGGSADLANKSKCLCNALFANIGLGNVYSNGYSEAPLITAGDILPHLDFVFQGITAREVVDILLA
ncbi:MAG: nitronate monooxygenase [Deferribacteraceae bacterium]|jgi:nitronate monooxygenase|nr:nitronate monooxygenase [Deferribacteraceae bacterium]